MVWNSCADVLKRCNTLRVASAARYWLLFYALGGLVSQTHEGSTRNLLDNRPKSVGSLEGSHTLVDSSLNARARAPKSAVLLIY